MNRLYQVFKSHVTWFNYSNEPIEITEITNFSLSDNFRNIFPITTGLINLSNKTGIKIDNKSFILFTWEYNLQICGWMCQMGNSDYKLIYEHQILIDNIGGIIEYFNGPENISINGIDYNYTLNLNHDYIFAGPLCENTIGGWEDYYHLICNENSCRSLNLNNKIIFAKEANGARTFYDTETKEVLLFSHDHDFKFIEKYENQPNYTIYKILGVNKFVDYVELLSLQWLTYLRQ